MIKVFTDYPFTEELRGSVFPIEVLTYDRNKYCKVRLPNGTIDECKCGYLFLDEKLERWLGNLIFTLPYKIGDKIPTRLQSVSEIREMKREKTYYKVYRGLIAYKFSTLHASLKFMNKIITDTKTDFVELYQYKEGKISWSADPIFSIELNKNGYEYFVTPNNKNSSVIKQHHIKKYFS